MPDPSKAGVRVTQVRFTQYIPYNVLVQVAAVEKKLESQTKKVGELQSEAQAAQERLCTSAAAVAALEAQLLTFQSHAMAQATAAQTLVDQTVAAAASATALRQAMGAKALAAKPARRGV